MRCLVAASCIFIVASVGVVEIESATDSPH